ncbi:MAG: hypothetical protein DYH18_08585 [Xanthomonadales bacterium PRO7]|nr:hypothetical protein [Xanthomonadales bacterium PRO7]
MKTRYPTTTIRNPAWYGWIPDLPDQRDHLYAAVHAIEHSVKHDAGATRYFNLTDGVTSALEWHAGDAIQSLPSNSLYAILRPCD